MSRFYRVHEFAELAGVTVKALHHYDRLGLLKPGRTEAGYRVYAEPDLERLEQIVALKLRGIPAPEIARAIGISDRAVRAGFNKALRRQTEDALDAWHRTELGGLAMEATNIWRLMDLTENKNDWRAQAALEDRLMRIHIRRAKLLGLDAPTKLDVSGIYQRGGADLEAEQRAREAVIEALPIEEQRRIYELFYQAGLRAAAGDLSPARHRPDSE